MKYRELKTELDKLTDDQLDQEVYASNEDASHIVDGIEISGEDTYWLDGDCYGNINEVVEQFGENWKEEGYKFHITLKGTVFLTI